MLEENVENSYSLVVPRASFLASWLRNKRNLKDEPVRWVSNLALDTRNMNDSVDVSCPQNNGAAREVGKYVCS